MELSSEVSACTSLVRLGTRQRGLVIEGGALGSIDLYTIYVDAI